MAVCLYFFTIKISKPKLHKKTISVCCGSRNAHDLFYRQSRSWMTPVIADCSCLIPFVVLSKGRLLPYKAWFLKLQPLTIIVVLTTYSQEQIWLWLHLSFYPSISLTGCLSFRLKVYVSVCLLSLTIYACLFVYKYISSLSIYCLIYHLYYLPMSICKNIFKTVRLLGIQSNTYRF